MHSVGVWSITDTAVPGFFVPEVPVSPFGLAGQHTECSCATTSPSNTLFPQCCIESVPVCGWGLISNGEHLLASGGAMVSAAMRHSTPLLERSVVRRRSTYTTMHLKTRQYKKEPLRVQGTLITEGPLDQRTVERTCPASSRPRTDDVSWCAYDRSNSQPCGYVRKALLRARHRVRCGFPPSPI